MTFTLKQGHRYRARISLGFFARVASNAAIADKLRGAGFVGVSVDGSGGERLATGTWPSSDIEADLPSQIAGVVDITTP